MEIKSKSILSVLSILFFLSMSLASCHREHNHAPKEKGKGNCMAKKDSTNSTNGSGSATCDTGVTVTLRNNICGVGLWGSFVLELENGDIVQPWASDSADLAKMELKDGQKIKVSFSEMQKDNRYDNVITCAAIGAYSDKIKAVVKVNCAKLII